MSFNFSTFRKPRPMPAARKGLNKVSKKGDFWLFVSKVLNKFFLKIEMDRRCEKCDGTSYCGVLTPAHTRRRQDIRVGDWYYAFRVAVLGDACHFLIDSKGRREAEPIIERIITERNKRLGITEDRWKELLMECVDEIQKEDAVSKSPKYQHYVVTL